MTPPESPSAPSPRGDDSLAAGRRGRLRPLLAAPELSSALCMLRKPPRFPALVASILTETELPPNLLEIEVTEGVLTSDSDAVANRLRELRRLGISIAIDDFGTGYSSLSLLGRLPFTRLKIDRAFVADCLVNRDSAAIVDMIIDLSRRLELSITAEGVETADQVAWLADRGVDVVQGFYFSRPVPLALADRLTQRDWHAYLAAEAVDESGWSIG